MGVHYIFPPPLVQPIAIFCVTIYVCNFKYSGIQMCVYRDVK